MIDNIKEKIELNLDPYQAEIFSIIKLAAKEHGKTMEDFIIYLYVKMLYKKGGRK
jgi:hypothetical protein